MAMRALFKLLHPESAAAQLPLEWPDGNASEVSTQVGEPCSGGSGSCPGMMQSTEDELCFMAGGEWYSLGFSMVSLKIGVFLNVEALKHSKTLIKHDMVSHVPSQGMIFFFFPSSPVRSPSALLRGRAVAVPRRTPLAGRRGGRAAEEGLGGVAAPGGADAAGGAGKKRWKKRGGFACFAG